MESMRYMSLVFRGVVEEYTNSGARPSVFMDGSGSLQVYLCDSIIEEKNEEYGNDVESDYDVNGGQFTDAYSSYKLLTSVPSVSMETKAVLESETKIN
ncbi:hypothetical protein V7O66_08345 [Methanolobus sp. ZRKC3]|uniref:hypothetical protein n=1 Tax=Methanolobus sp. ZRKC3 TaxID=3125786 RepID=UPI00324789F5